MAHGPVSGGADLGLRLGDALAELAIEAASVLLARRVQTMTVDPMVDQAMGDLSTKLQ